MNRRIRLTAVLAVSALGLAATGAVAASGSGKSKDTEADYTPIERFDPLAASSPCVGAGSGRDSNPFVLPERSDEDDTSGYDQVVVAEEGQGGTEDLWDMNTQNEFGKDAGRFVFRTHEVRAGAQVTVTDLEEDDTEVLAERNDWERFDGIVWTPYGTILAAEETVVQNQRDPNAPQARGGLVYEFYVDRKDPSKLDPRREPQGTATRDDDGTSDVTRDGIRVRPALGAKSHEGMRFDRRGNHYGIAETRGRTTANQTGGIFRFIPDEKNEQGPLARGQLQAFDSPNGQDGQGRWVDLNRTRSQEDADAEAERQRANEYQRPEDVETGESTGRDRNNGGNTLYVALTEGEDEGVLALDLSRKDRPFAYDYVGKQAGNASEPDFDSPDNLALDRKGNLAITEDPGGVPPTKQMGDDIFIASPPSGDDDDDEGGKRRQPADEVERFASIKDCNAEPTGIYFALEGTEKFTEDNEDLKELVTDESLFVNRQHSGQNTDRDQFVSIAPVEEEDEDQEGDDEEQDEKGSGSGSEAEQPGSGSSTGSDDSTDADPSTR
jgi:hypothetical protein